MQLNPKRILLSTTLALAVVGASLTTGCKTEDRTAGMQLDDHVTAHRVRSALADAPVYKFGGVHVEVFDGITQLSGWTYTQEQKKYAADIASRVEGVRQVVNSINLKPEGVMSPTGYRYGNQYPAAPTPGNPNPQPRPYNNNGQAYDANGQPIQQPARTPAPISNQNPSYANPNQP